MRLRALRGEIRREDIHTGIRCYQEDMCGT